MVGTSTTRLPRARWAENHLLVRANPVSRFMPDRVPRNSEMVKRTCERESGLTFASLSRYSRVMRFWVGFTCGIIFGILAGGYGAAYLFFDEYMHSPVKTAKQVPALPLEQIPTSQGGFAPSLGDKPLEKLIEDKERKQNAKKKKTEPLPPPAEPPPAPPSERTPMPAEAVDPSEIGD